MNPARSQDAMQASPGDFLGRSLPLQPLPLPGAGQVDLWFMDLRQLAGALARSLDGEAADNGGSEGPELTLGQRRFVRRFYLKLLLGTYLGIPGKDVKINRSTRGKPELDPSSNQAGLQFSMAKSGDNLLLGLTTGNALGVDLERVDRRPHDALGVARRYFSAAEAEALATLSKEDMHCGFLRTWACKEAVVKASGLGIANQLCRFSVQTRPDRPAALLAFENESLTDWSLALVQPDAGHVGALALRAAPLELRTFRLLAPQS